MRPPSRRVGLGSCRKQEHSCQVVHGIGGGCRGTSCFHDRLHAYAPGWDFPKLNPADHLTVHFGLVSDFLSECWDRMRHTGRLASFQSRVFWGGALSGRDIEAVNKTMSGLLKLLFPDPTVSIEDTDLEWVARCGESLPRH